MFEKWLMLASTHFDPVLGVDIHIVLVPTPAGPVPTPVPMPFIGMVFDPVGMVIGCAISCATTGGPGLVLVNGIPATNCGTGVKNMIPHLPAPGVSFVKPPGNDAELFFGGDKVTFGGSLAVRLGDVALSCSDPVRLPTSVVLAIPKGMPVLVPRPMVPDFMAIAMSFAMKGLFKGLGKGWSKFRAFQRSSKFWQELSERARNAFSNVKSGRIRSLWSRMVCHVTGHPVDVATGRMFTEFGDITLPGPIPLEFNRVYDSSLSDRRGPLGYGWSHSLDEALWEEDTCFVYHAPDGRELEFPKVELPNRKLDIGESVLHPLHQVKLSRTGEHTFEVEHADGILHELGPVPSTSKLGTATLKVLQRKDRFGNAITFHYDARGLLEWVRDSAGRVLRFEHDERGRLTKLKLPLAKERGWYTYRTFEHDSHDNLVRITDSRNHSWEYDYVGHLVVQEKDRSGLSFYFQWDTTGAGAKCIRTWGDGGILDHTLVYDMRNRRTVVEDSLGAMTQYQMNEMNQVIQVTDARGAITKHEYDPLTGKKTSTTDPLGNVSHTTLDHRGHPTRVEDPEGWVEISYDPKWADSPCAKPVHVKSSEGLEARKTYDALGRLEHEQNFYGQETRYTWEGADLLEVREDHNKGAYGGEGQDERVFQFTHEGGLCIGGVRPNGGKFRAKYDGLGRLISFRDARGGKERRWYDSESNLVGEQMPTGLERRYEYNEEDRPIRIVDAFSDITLGYTGFHMLARREEAGTVLEAPYVLEAEYDKENRLTLLRNEAQETHTFVRDACGDVVEETSFEGLTHQYLRDRAGTVLSETLPSGNERTFGHDALGRVTSVEHPDGSVEHYRYDARGRLEQARNEDVSLSYLRDGFGRVLREKVTTQDQERWVDSEYGNNQLRAAVFTSTGHSHHYTRDLEGQVTAVGLPPKRDILGEHERTIRIERDLLGAEVGRTLPGNVHASWQRTAAGLPFRHTVHRYHRDDQRGTQAPPETVKDDKYGWHYQRLKVLEDAQGIPTEFHYDPRGHSTGRHTLGGDYQLRAVDAVGNPYRNSSLKGRTYGPGGRLLNTRDTTYEYDDDGNLSKKIKTIPKADGLTQGTTQEVTQEITREVTQEITEYAWNGAGRLKAVTLPTGKQVNFQYDPFGRRIRKQVTTAEGKLEREVTWLWDGDTPLTEHDSKEGETTWVFEPGTHNPLAKLKDKEMWGVLTDHLGTPTELVNEAGKIAWKAQLDLYGVRHDQDWYESTDCPFRFPGQYQDDETGLYYNRHRYYDPETGQYTRPDPIGIYGGLRSRGYVDDVLTEFDPLGLTTNSYTVSPNRRIHILEGDPPGTGHGPNRGHTQGAFPDTWTDDYAIAAVERVANGPKSTWRQSTGPGFDTARITTGGPDPNAPMFNSKGNPVRFEVHGRDHGLDITVIVEPNGEGIVTGYVRGR